MNPGKTRGSALAAVLVITILMGGLVAALFAYSAPFLRTSAAFNQNLYALYGAEGALEEVRYQVSASKYDSNGNLWLMANSSPTGKLVYSGLVVGASSVDVTIYDLGNDYYRAVAVATHSRARVRLVQDLRSRDTFGRYMFFVDVDDLNVGSTTVRGSVYTGANLNNYFGGAHYYNDVSAVKNITYNSGATTANTTFDGPVAANAPKVNMPTVNTIADLHKKAVGVYNITDEPGSAYAGMGAMDSHIQFSGNQVNITAYKKGTSVVLKSGSYPLPSNGLIFSQGDVTSVQGDTSGRTTVATMGNVGITDRVRYTDAAGNLEYILYKSDGVTPVPDNGRGDFGSWTAEGYVYKKNPAFSPDLTNPPVVGFMAANDITIVDGAPYNMEMMAAVFSGSKRWSCDLTHQKGNLKVLGSIVNHLGGWRYNGAGYGYAKSGEYIYDKQLLQNPPPFWLPVDKPVFGPRRQEA